MAEPDTLDFSPSAVAVARTSNTNSSVEMENVELALSIEVENGETVDFGKKAREVLSEREPVSENCFRAEIDTSAPFESVKEAAIRFGGIGFWKPRYLNKVSDAEHGIEELDTAKMEEQAAQLEKDLIAKEEETLSILKELESAKLVVEELRSKLQKQAFDLNVAEEEKENHESNPNGRFSLYPSSAPGLILLQLKQAKLNLNKTTSDLSDIRASIESYIKKIEEGRIDVEKTRKRLSSNSSKISSLQEEINRARKKIQLVKMGEEANSEIEQTKLQIKTVEIRLVAAKKMKEAAIAAEAIALAEIKALSNKENPQKHEEDADADAVTLSMEEYSSLTSIASQAEQLSERKITNAMDQVDEANISKMEILKKVEEATEEVKASKKALQEALNLVKIAKREKLCVEDALRKQRRSEHGRKRRSVHHNSSKFKNSCRKGSLNPAQNGEPMPVLRPTLSIGQILSRKLLNLEDIDDDKEMERDIIGDDTHKISLGQMLGKVNGELPIVKNVENENGFYRQQVYAKRKKFRFVAPFSLLLSKQSKKKKKSSIYRCSGFN